MTTQEMEIKRTASLRALLAPKIIEAVDDQMTVDWLSSMMTTITDGYKITKELMRQHIPSLKLATTSSVYAVNPKPEYNTNTDIHSFNARYLLWLQIEQKHRQPYAERENTHYFIGQLDKDPHYKEAITKAKWMCLIDSIAPIPQKYNIIHIARTLITHQDLVLHSDMDITKPQNHNIRLQISATEAKKPVKQKRPQQRP